MYIDVGRVVVGLVMSGFNILDSYMFITKHVSSWRGGVSRSLVD
jgi:hypothetical protein